MAKAKPKEQGRADRPPGTIEADTLYTLDEFKARTGLGDTALREARRRGLRIHLFGNRKFVLGRDVLDYLARGDSDEDA